MIPDNKLTIDISEDSPSDYDGKCCYIRAVHAYDFRIAEVGLQLSETVTTKVKLDFVPVNGDKIFFVVEYWEDITSDDDDRIEIRVTHGYRHEWDASNHKVNVPKRDQMYIDVSHYVWMGVVGVVVPGWV